MSDRNPALSAIHVYKSYGEEPVLRDLNLSLPAGGVFCLTAPSGGGKTTLFRLIMGLEQPDSGQITFPSGSLVSAVFQENRLIEHVNAIQNLRFVTGRRYTSEELRSIAGEILPADSLQKPVREFSGGMKRRTALLRALLAPSDLLIFDEPFTGLDPASKEKAAELIKRYQSGRLLLFSSHQPEDAAMLGALTLSLSELQTP